MISNVIVNRLKLLPFNRVTDPRISSKLLSNVDCTSVGVVDSLPTKPLILKPRSKFQIL